MSRTSEPNTSAIEDVAQSIIKMLGPCSLGQARLSSTGRSPIFPDISLCELVPVSLLQGLGHAVRTQLADIVEERLSSMRQRYLDRYRQLVHKMYSLDHAGFADLDHEMALCGTIEARYHRCISEIRRNLIRLLGQPATIGDNRNTRGGFGDRTLLILETAFSHTKSPLASEIEHLSRLTSLEPHQVRTWFQNKRNRGNKVNGKKINLRVASASHVQGSTQLPNVDGRRVASLPSRKYAPTPAGRVTRALPRRNANVTQIQAHEVPLARTLSQESRGSFGSDETTFSYSSAPSNGGFTGFTYPSIPNHPSAPVQQQPTFNLDPLIAATYGPAYGPPPFAHQHHDMDQPRVPFNQDMVNPHQPVEYHQYDQSINSHSYSTIPNQQSQSEIDFESYLNLNIDNLAPPTDTLGYDFEAQVQAALRSDPMSYNTTLAPTLSPSLSPLSVLSEEWFNDFDFTSLGAGDGDEEGEGMELLKVVLDGMSRSGSVGESPIEKSMDGMGMEIGGGMGVRPESPETVASFTLNSEGVGSGRQPPAGPSTLSTSNLSNTHSVTGSEGEESLSFMFNFDLEVPQSHGTSMDYGNMTAASESGSGWMTGVLPFDMGDHVMGTA